LEKSALLASLFNSFSESRNSAETSLAALFALAMIHDLNDNAYSLNPFSASRAMRQLRPCSIATSEGQGDQRLFFAGRTVQRQICKHISSLSSGAGNKFYRSKQDGYAVNEGNG
jgi:hypothetical protein